MFDIVKDCYNEYDENLKKVKLNDLSAIYFCNNSNNNYLFFEKYNNFWTYENNKGKYDYKINDDNFTIENLVNQLIESKLLENNFTIRVFDYINNQADYIKFILPGKRKLINQELFGNYELSRLDSLNSDLYKDNEEELKKFKNEMKIVASDVGQIVRLISAQGHTNETLKLTMTLVSNILANIPITDITDDEMSKNDWVDFDEVENNEELKEYFKVNGLTIKTVLLNIRCTRIVKVIYTNNKTNDEEIVYYDTHARIYIDSDEKEAYFGELSIDEIEMPWAFKPTEEVLFDEKNKEDMKKNMVKYSDIMK